MLEPSQPPRISQPIALLAALLAVPALWLTRDLIGVDVALRLVLPALWLAVWTTACLAAGTWTLRLLLGRADRAVLAEVLAAGAAALALALALAALVGLLRPAVVAVVLVLAAVEGARLLVVARVRPSLPPIALGSAPGIVLAAAAAAVLALTTAPPVMFDVLNYHLAFPARWLAAGGFVEFPRHIYAYYPSAHGLDSSFALATVGPWGANAIHWWFGAVAVLAAAELGLLLGGKRAATWAAACLGLTPVVLEIAGYAIADLAVAAFAGAALVVLARRTAAPHAWRAAAAAGLLAGSAAAAKYLALVTAVVPVALAMLVLIGRRRAVAGAAFAVAACIALAPWLGRNAAWTGNPVYPYFQAALGGPPAERDVAAEMENAGPRIDAPGAVAGAMAAPLVRLIEPLRAGGLIGAHWLILLPAALAVRGLERRLAVALWIAAVSSTLAWGALVQYARFLVPAMVPGAALAGGAAAALAGSSSRTVARTFTAVLVGILAWHTTVLATRFNLDRLAVVTGELAERDFMDRWVSYGPAIPVVDAEVPEDATILMVGEPRSLYIDRRVLVEDPYRTPLLVELARGCSSPAELATAVRGLGATHVLVNTSEMEFYAGMRRQDGFWAETTPAERERITAFLTDQVRPLLRTDRLLVGEIVEESR